MDGKYIRVCVDMRQANEAIIQERHPILTIEEVLYDLNGATVFSKIDLKWRFHEIELEGLEGYCNLHNPQRIV